MPRFFPVLIDLKKFPCLIVGGGKVAHRKAVSLLKFNARVTVVAPRFCQALLKLSGHDKIKIIRRGYSAEHLRDFKLVFAATDNPTINRRVRSDCSKAGVLLNVVDDRAMCDIILPAIVRRGDLVIAVSSQGKAPFFTVAVKKLLEDFVSPSFREAIKLAAKLRRQVLKSRRLRSSTARKRIFKRFAAIDWQKVMADGGKRRARRKLQQMLNEHQA